MWGTIGTRICRGEKQAILDSLRLESEVEAKRHRRQEAEAEHGAEVEEMIAYMDEEEELEPSFEPIYPLLGNDVVDIPDDES